MKKLESGRTLIGLLVAMALVAGLVVYYTNGPGGEGSTRPDGQGNTTIGRSALAAKDSVCMRQIRQVRMSIQIKTDHVDEIYPESLASLGLGEEFESCPIGGEPYNYNPEAGLVYCPHPGHEKY